MSLWQGARIESIFWWIIGSSSYLPNVTSLPDSVLNLFSFCVLTYPKVSFNHVIQLLNWYLKTKFFSILYLSYVFNCLPLFPKINIFLKPGFSWLLYSYKCAQILLVNQLKTQSCLFPFPLSIYCHLTFTFCFTSYEAFLFMNMLLSNCNNMHEEHAEIMA